MSSTNNGLLHQYIWPLLLLLSCLDLTYSAYQHYHTSLEGDIASIVVPKTEYREVLENPFGLAAIREGKHYAGTNRFFCHYSMKWYFSKIPLLISKFIDKIDAIYWSSSAFKIFVQLLLLLLMAMYAHAIVPWKVGSFTLLLVLLTPFFQTTGYVHVLALINPSITYVFFYSWPVSMLLLFYYPFFKSFVRQEPIRLGFYSKLGLAFLTVFLPFSSPLNAPIILLISLLYLTYRFLQFRRVSGATASHIRQWLSIKIWNSSMLFMGIITLFALYTTYLGQFNTENTANVLPLWERYARLLQGLGTMFTIKLGYPVLLGALGISWYLFRRTTQEDAKAIRKLIRWAIIFFIAYILLLPLGGYRAYRPYIVRSDTMLPVSCGLVILYGTLALYLLRRLSSTRLKLYATLLIGVAVIFTVADGPNFTHNAAERKGLEVLQLSEADTVVFPQGQLVLSWNNLEKPEDSRWNAILLEQWGVTDTLRLYYNQMD